MHSLGFFLLMFVGGIAVALQPSINGRLAVALVAGRGSFRGLAGAQAWELTGGFLGAFFVTLTILIVPRIGTAAAMAATIAAQLTTGILLDHFGLFGFRVVPLDPKRAVGACLLLAGAALLFRR